MINRIKRIVKWGILPAIFFSACTEIPPFIDFSVKVDGLLDTTYLTTSIPAPVNTAIYIEDLTGVNCSNCPKAADKIKEITAANPDHTIALGVYPWSLTGLTAPWPGFDTLNTNEADDIFNNVYNSPSAIPCGGVNRKLFSGETILSISYNKWAGYADLIKVTESPVIITGTILKYDDVTRKARIRAKVVFPKSYTPSLNLSVFLIEDNILSKQHMPDGTKKDDYVHNHALRKAITPFNGVTLKIDAGTNGNYEAGRVFEKDFEVTLSSKWKDTECGIVILANRYEAGNKEVVQAAHIELK